MTISIVIAAHNEAQVIGRCLDTLLAAGYGREELDVTVVANGCADGTAEEARARPGVRVIELTEASKAAALNAGDEAATSFPRVYLDADMTFTADQIRTLAAALDAHGVLASTASRVPDSKGAALPIKGYYAINRRLPAFRGTLFGRGVIVLAKEGRSRFDRFPGIVADDLFLDSLFTPGEKREVTSVVSRVATPRRTGDLVRRLARVRAGNRSLRATSTQVREAGNSAWLRVSLRRPWLLPAAVCYFGITVAAELKARRGTDWGHDASSRTAASA